MLRAGTVCSRRVLDGPNVKFLSRRTITRFSLNVLGSPHRSHRSEHEVRQHKLLLLLGQQPRSGERRGRGFSAAQPPGGDSGEAAHRWLQRVRSLPAAFCRRAGKPDPAAELSQTVPTAPSHMPRPPQPVHLSRSVSHTSEQTSTHKDTMVHE